MQYRRGFETVREADSYHRVGNDLNSLNFESVDGEWEGITAIMASVTDNNIAVFNRLLSFGVDIERREERYGCTVLHFAVEYEREEMVKTLIQSNANTEIRDNYGYSPLSLAVAYGCTEIVETLSENGADTNTKDNNEETCLMKAAIWGKKDCAEILLRNGAKINLKNNEGDTAIYWARTFHKPEVIEVIERHIRIRSESVKETQKNVILYRNPNRWNLLKNENGEQLFKDEALEVFDRVPPELINHILAFANDKIIPFGKNRGGRTEKLTRDIADTD